MSPRLPAPMAAGPSGPAMTVSTTPIATLARSAVTMGAARANMGRNSRRKSENNRAMKDYALGWAWS